MNTIFSKLLETSLAETLSTPCVIIGMILAGIGLALCLLARRITMAIRKTEKLENGDKLYLTLLAFALVFILVGMVVTCINRVI